MNAEWKKTVHAYERLHKKGLLEIVDGDFYYGGRPIICRDSPIDGRVCIGEITREAIVVDSAQSEHLKKLFDDLYEQVVNTHPNSIEILRDVYTSVYKAMPIQNEREVERITSKYGVDNDSNISLDVFVKDGVGVCRQDALICGFLVEQLIKKGVLSGQVSIDRNTFFPLGSHMWCRYVFPTNAIFVLDVAKKFFGSLEEGTQKFWPYNRPSDL